VYKSGYVYVSVAALLAADGAGRALEHGGYVAQTVVELEKTGHGDAVFGL
jgi:hypothetical protein